MTMPNTGTKLGRYEILSLLGAGGMGEVFLADTLFGVGEPSAVKARSGCL